MSGFADNVLSFLLSWIRALVSNIWTMINSEDGGALYQFLAKHWLSILIVICAAGFVIDRLVYLIRWRPYYVWQSKWARLRRRDDPAPEQPEQAPAMAYAPAYESAMPTQVYAAAQPEEPVFDEPIDTWDVPEWQERTQVDFGRPRPEPIAYYHDVQAGFAPPIPPEELYAPRVKQQSDPVHPGLNEDIFRQNIGIAPEARPQRRRYNPDQANKV